MVPFGRSMMFPGFRFPWTWLWYWKWSMAAPIWVTIGIASFAGRGPPRASRSRRVSPSRSSIA